MDGVALGPALRSFPSPSETRGFAAVKARLCLSGGSSASGCCRVPAVSARDIETGVEIPLGGGKINSWHRECLGGASKGPQSAQPEPGWFCSVGGGLLLLLLFALFGFCFVF